MAKNNCTRFNELSDKVRLNKKLALDVHHREESTFVRTFTLRRSYILQCFWLERHKMVEIGLSFIFLPLVDHSCKKVCFAALLFSSEGEHTAEQCLCRRDVLKTHNAP